jgi:hypothetical protein
MSLVSELMDMYSEDILGWKDVYFVVARIAIKEVGAGTSLNSLVENAFSASAKGFRCRGL